MKLDHGYKAGGLGHGYEAKRNDYCLLLQPRSSRCMPTRWSELTPESGH